MLHWASILTQGDARRRNLSVIDAHTSSSYVSCGDDLFVLAAVTKEARTIFVTGREYITCHDIAEVVTLLHGQVRVRYQVDLMVIRNNLHWWFVR